MDVYKVTIQDVYDTAKKYSFDVHRKANYYIIVCDEHSGSSRKNKLPDNPHGYTEAITYLDELCDLMRY